MKAVLLAAGRSSRMWPLAQKRNKCMLEFLGKPLLFYTINGLKQTGVKDFVIVISSSDSNVKDYFGNGSSFGVKIEYAVQKKPLGTGDALLCAEGLIDDNFVVCNATNANAGIIAKEMLKHKTAVAAAETENPQDYGIINQKNGKLTGIVEKPENKGKGLASIGLYVLPKEFFEYLKKEEGEYSLINAINRFCKKNEVAIVKTNQPHLTLKYPWHVLETNKYFLDNSKGSISGKARISGKATITGKVIVGENAVIEENAVIRGPCYIGKNCTIRNGCLLREYTSLSDNVLLGYGTETKNAVIYSGTKTHTNYVSDSIIGENVRLGCGTITANRRNDRKNVMSVVKGEKTDTGTTFFGTAIGANTHIGINCSLMPGVKIGNNCLIGPASVVFDDVPDNSKMYSKYETIIKKRME